jgi:predicted heme/steroid binding protein
MELYQFMSIEVSNGFIYVGGSGIHYDQSDAYKGHKGYMLKLNQAGDSLWSHFYDYNPNEYNELNQFYDFHFHSDNEIVAVGYHELRNPDYTYFSQGWIVKMDSNGMAPGSYTISMEETQLVIKKQKPLLYPNPTTDNFHLRFEENQNQDLQLSIFSISGTLVKQQQLPAFAYEYRVDIQELKSGVYTVRLMSENQVIFSDKIIKR